MGFWSTIAKVGGAAGGFMLGGPAGAMAGYSLGSALGGGGGAQGGGSQGQPAPVAARPVPQAPAMTPLSADPGIAASRAKYQQTVDGGQDALNTMTQGAISSAMPQFKQQLQGIRESAERRGISNGEIATNYEGDAASAFQRNIANALASQAATMHGQQQQGAADLYHGDVSGAQSDREFGRETTNDARDWESSQLDRQTAQKNADANRSSSVWGSILNTAGQLGGAYLSSRGKGGK